MALKGVWTSKGTFSISVKFYRSSSTLLKVLKIGNKVLLSKSCKGVIDGKCRIVSALVGKSATL